MRRTGEGSKDLVDLVIGLEGVPQRPIQIHLVDVVAPLLASDDVAGRDQIADDAVRGALTDTDPPRDLCETNLGILHDAQQYVGVVREEGPRR